MHFKALLTVILCMLVPTQVLANPILSEVVRGQADISSNNGVMTINNSNKTIINWQSFTIQNNEVTRFIQSNENSRVLNRIVGQDPSQILGKLESNGQVFLVNPNGVLFGANSVVDASTLIVSSLNITDENFINGQYQFEAAASNGSGNVVNHGYIKADNVFILAPSIANGGIIKTVNGQTVLAAGEKVSIVGLDAENIAFEIQSAENQLINIGSIIAENGVAALFGGVITQTGEVQASQVIVDELGTVIFKTDDTPSKDKDDGTVVNKNSFIEIENVTNFGNNDDRIVTNKNGVVTIGNNTFVKGKVIIGTVEKFNEKASSEVLATANTQTEELFIASSSSEKMVTKSPDKNKEEQEFGRCN